MILEMVVPKLCPSGEKLGTDSIVYALARQRRVLPDPIGMVREMVSFRGMGVNHSSLCNVLHSFPLK